MRLRSLALALLVLATVVCSALASAEPARSPMTPVGQGVAVLGLNGAREDAFILARAVYASSLRPQRLDELRARVLAGDPPPTGTSKPIHELAELRASLRGVDDAPSRRVLAAIAHDVGAEALLVVSRSAPVTPDPAPVDADGGAPATPATAAPVVVARLFLAGTAELDAARYEPDPARPDGPWAATVRSLAPRFPPPAAPPAAKAQPAPPVRMATEGNDSKPFYSSTWFWAAIGGAALVGALIFFAAQDTTNDPIHLQMRIPR